jgi:hypothetical protein
MATPPQEIVSTQESDYLDQDPPLRSQNYVCLSFISPEDVIKKKEVFFFEEFLKHISADMSEFFTNLKGKYPDDAGTLTTIQERYAYLFSPNSINDEFSFFQSTHSQQLEEIYHKENKFQTSIRGIKVRGVFDTIREAEIRAQVLKKMDDKFNVYVAQVGCWCPWSPNPEDIENQEYAETHLNTMMKHYKDNQDKKDIFYQERKRELQFVNTKKTITDEDPWMTKKQEAETPAEPVDSTTPEATATTTTTASEETLVVASEETLVVASEETLVVASEETPVVASEETPVVATEETNSSSV